MTTKKTGVKTPKQKKVKTIKIPTGNIDKDFDIISEYATSKITNREMIEPTLFIIDSKNKKMSVVGGHDLPRDADKKQRIFENIGLEYAEKMPGADLFIMMMEAWASASTKEDLENGKRQMMMPSEDPNRIEVYIVTAKKSNGEEKYFTQAFKRDKDGNAELLDRSEMESLNMDWAKPVEKNGVTTENRLLGALWKKFMFTKIVNECK